MKKILVVVTAMALLACALVGCSGNSGVADANESADAGGAILMAGNYLDLGLTDASGAVIAGDVLQNGDIVCGQVDAENRLQVGSVIDGKYRTLTEDYFPVQELDAQGRLAAAGGLVPAQVEGELLIGGQLTDGVLYDLDGQELTVSLDNKGYAVRGYLLADGTITDLNNTTVGTVDQAGNVTDASGNKLGNMLTN